VEHNVNWALDGRVVLVTGGSGGIGAALIERLVRSGAKPVNVDVQLAKTELAPFYQGDVTDEAGFEAIVAQVEREVGPIDALVHAGAIQGTIDSMVNIPVADWRQVLDINTTGTFITNKVVARRMVERGKGSIVNFASSAGIKLYIGQGPYNISKAAVPAITKQLAQEVHAQGVRVNCIDPGGILTPMVRDLGYRDLTGMSAYAKQFQQVIREEIETGVLSEPEEVLDLILFLVSDASWLINGQFVRNSQKNLVFFEQ
jgi:NAD(P)-dependent dehydrogenase (short-subunit alcohol dehydrogenase family)